jgi:hypothetical protein
MSKWQKWTKTYGLYKYVFLLDEICKNHANFVKPLTYKDKVKILAVAPIRHQVAPERQQ